MVLDIRHLTKIIMMNYCKPETGRREIRLPLRKITRSNDLQSRLQHRLLSSNSGTIEAPEAELLKFYTPQVIVAINQLRYNIPEYIVGLRLAGPEL